MSAGKIRVLVVEDDAVDRMAFLRHVEKEKLPYQCTTAGSIAEAQEILRNGEFDAIVLDHNLGDASGFDLLPHVGEIPVIFVTGSESPEVAVQAMKAGASDYLLKDHERNYLRFMPLSVDRALKQRSSRNELRESQELFRQSFKEAPIGKAFLQPDGKFLRVNRALCEMAGATEEEMLANGFKILFDIPPSPGCVEKLFPAPADSSQAFRTERPSRNKKGEEVFLQLDVATVPDSLGQNVTCVLHAQDITVKKKAEEIHARLEKQLYQAQKMEALGNLAGGVAHEFNNMLGAIIGYTELSRMELGEGHAAIPNLEQVLKASNRAKEIIQQILTFSRRQEVKRELIQVQPMVKDAVKLIRPVLPTNVDLDANIATGGPPIFGNVTQIHQALVNLCTNSWHAMEEGGGKITIRQEAVELRRDNTPARLNLPEGKYVIISVADTGKGMDEATLNRVFEPFFTTKGPGRGSGLGMPVVDGIMKAHDGAVLVTSEVGKGTKVLLYFPASSGQVAERPTPEKVALPRGKGERIMLVDDELTLVQLGAMVLRRLGYNPMAFTSPKEAVDALRQKPDEFELIITDLTMPGMTGLELATACQKIRPGIPIILASGFVEEAIRDEAPFIGIRKILGKPLTAHILADAVHALLAPTAAT